jgi:hypothetical protein
MLLRDTKFLFGSATPGAAKLEILSEAFDQEGSAISRQKTFLLAREIFPTKKELHGKIYEHFGLDVLDAALGEGLPNWSSDVGETSTAATHDDSDQALEPTATTERVKASDRMNAFYSTLKRKRASHL